MQREAVRLGALPFQPVIRGAFTPQCSWRRCIATTSHTLDPDPPPELIRPAEPLGEQPRDPQLPPRLPSAHIRPNPYRSQPRDPTAQDHTSIHTLLPLLRAQGSHYITLHIHAKRYLVTPGDSIRLPFLMPDANVGDVLRLDRASIIGSRDFTLKGNPYIDDRLFMCRATVVSVESEPIRIKEKTKRRNRKVKKVKSKHRFTVIRVSELKINPAPVGEAMASSTVSSNAGLSAASNPGESLTAAL